MAVQTKKQTRKKSIKKKTLVKAEKPKSLKVICPEILNIASVKIFYEELREILSQSRPIVINAEQVESADTASLQMLYSFYQYAQEIGVNVQWQKPSNVFYTNLSLLGLAGSIGLSGID